MRNPDRIKPYCETLATIWGLVPDWRLSQLMVNACLAYKNEHDVDPFYVEDEDFLHFLYAFISNAINN